MNFKLNSDQEYIVSEAVNWFYRSSEQVFQYDGPPGSGKSVVLNAIVERLGLDIRHEVAPMSFIGAASLVMRTKGLVTAKTAHSWIYDPVLKPLRDDQGHIIYNDRGKPVTYTDFEPKTHLPYEIKLIIIDEAYCMPRRMRPVIEKFGIKIIACGDQNQLPPVQDNPAFLVDGKIYHLTQVMRQAGLDDILFIANRSMLGLPLLNGYYGNSMVIDREDLSDSMLLWADMVICGTNNTRDKINQHIRYLKGFTSSALPCYGERMIIRNNNWDDGVIDSNNNTINLVNGLIATVTNQPSVDSYNKLTKCINMQFVPDLAQDCVFNIGANYEYLISDSKQRMALKNSRFTRGVLAEFAYAITCHLSQGSQFHKVIYIEENLHPSIQPCLNLVGCTRADQQLIYVKNNYRAWQDYDDPIQAIKRAQFQIEERFKRRNTNEKHVYRRENM